MAPPNHRFGRWNHWAKFAGKTNISRGKNRSFSGKFGPVVRPIIGYKSRTKTIMNDEVMSIQTDVNEVNATI